MVEVGMAVQKSVQTRGAARLGIIRYILHVHPYCFSLRYHYLKSSMIKLRTHIV